MFNDDQRDHMRALSEAPREKKCLCGWNWLGDCYHPDCVAQTEEVKRQRAEAKKTP